MEAHKTYQHFHPWQSCAPLKATSPPTWLWQRAGPDLFDFDGHESLVIADYYSNSPIVHKIQQGQCNAAWIISLLKEFFSEHDDTWNTGVW